MSETDAEEAVESAAPDDVEGSLDDVDLSALLRDEAFLAAIGREFGAAVGREFGAVVGRAVDDRLRERFLESGAEGDADDDESGGYLVRFVQWIVEQVSDILGGESVEDASEENGDADAEEQPEAGESEEPEAGEEDEQPEAADEADQAEASDEETDHQDAESEDDKEDPEEVFERLDVDDAPKSADELRDLSYRQLQSAAKKVGVKANLSRDELTTKVAEQLGFDADA